MPVRESLFTTLKREPHPGVPSTAVPISERGATNLWWRIRSRRFATMGLRFLFPTAGIFLSSAMDVSSSSFTTSIPVSSSSLASLPSFFSIDFPGHVRNVSQAIHMLGGEEHIRKVNHLHHF